MNKKIWQWPWRYIESLIITSGLVAGGVLIQLISGPFNFYFLHQPVNYIIGGLIILMALAALRFRQSRAVKWLSGVHLAVSLITALLLMSLIMGLIPQMTSAPPDGGLPVRLGFTQVTSAWPFVLVYLATLISLAMITVQRLFSSRKHKWIFILNHAGLWLVLAAAGLGAADRERHVMYVQQGEVEWRVYSKDNQVLELPLAIRLDEFSMEEYAPKLAIIDRESGDPLPKGRPDLFQIDMEQPKGRLLDWDITLVDYLYQAVPAGNGAYQYSNMPASTQAVQVLARNVDTKAIIQGWISVGNRFLPIAAMPLDDKQVMVMSQPEPKKFTSIIKVFSQDGQEKEAVLEVNKPLKIGHWMIYQYGYDNQAGRMSSYSSFELVYDPWLYPAYGGMILWALGSLGLIYQGKGRRKAA